MGLTSSQRKWIARAGSRQAGSRARGANVGDCRRDASFLRLPLLQLYRLSYRTFEEF